MIAIVDYGRGNLFSIAMALEQFGATYKVTDDIAIIQQATKIILPGVGSFGYAMSSLIEKDLVATLTERALGGAPILGICLGMQLLATQSEEFTITKGLNLIPGNVKKLSSGPDIRIPNIGWRKVRPAKQNILADVFSDNTMMYFVHSYAFFLDETEDVVATIDVNGSSITAMVRRGNIIGCQFHPEKSGKSGLKLIRWFLDLCK